MKDIEGTWRFLDSRGGTFLSEIQAHESERGRFRTFNIATPLDDVTFRFIQREGEYTDFAPDFEDVNGGVPAENTHGFATIDHVTSNAHDAASGELVRDVLGFNHFWDVEFHTVDEWTAAAA